MKTLTLKQIDKEISKLKSLKDNNKIDYFTYHNKLNILLKEREKLLNE